MAGKSKPLPKNEAIQQEVLALKAELMPARIIHYVDKILPAFLSKNRPGLFVLPMIFLAFLLLLLGYRLAIFLDELNNIKDLLLPTIIFTAYIVVTFIATHLISQSLLDDISTHIVTKITDAKSLEAFIAWLKASWSFRHVIPYVLTFALIYEVLATVLLSYARQTFVGFSFAFINVLGGFSVGVQIYYILWVVQFAYRLRDYQYDLNTFSPGDSEIIARISSILNKQLYVFAVSFAILTLLASIGIIEEKVVLGFTLPVLITGWLITTIGFLFLRSTINHIVQEAVWRLLNKIQNQINQIEKTQDLSDKKTGEKITQLTDLYQKVLQSRTKIFELKYLPDFFSQLMLPLLGVLLGNLDLVLDLIS